MIGVDVVTARTLGQHDPRGVVRRDVAVAIFGQVLGEVADGHHQVGVPSVELFELPQDGARIEAFLEQKHRLRQGLGSGHHRTDVRRFRNVLELWLLDFFAEIDVLKGKLVIEGYPFSSRLAKHILIQKIALDKLSMLNTIQM